MQERQLVVFFGFPQESGEQQSQLAVQPECDVVLFSMCGRGSFLQVVGVGDKREMLETPPPSSV